MTNDSTNSFLSLFGKICAIFISFLGFSSCSNDEYMYGTPYGTFDVKGTVTDEAGEGVDGAVIDVKYPGGQYYDFSWTADTTDNKGKYAFKGSSSFAGDIKLICIPPEESGLASDSTIVDLVYEGKKKDWCWGHAEATVDFKLKKKPAADDNIQEK